MCCARSQFDFLGYDKTCKNMIKQAKGVIKKYRHKHMLVDMLKAMQKSGNVNFTLKLPVKTRWASMVTSLESVQENKVVLFPKSQKKKQKLVRSPAHSSGRHILT